MTGKMFSVVTPILPLSDLVAISIVSYFCFNQKAGALQHRPYKIKSCSIDNLSEIDEGAVVPAFLPYCQDFVAELFIDKESGFHAAVEFQILV